MKRPPLSLAAHRGQAQVVARLLEAKACVLPGGKAGSTSAKREQETSPILVCCAGGSSECLRLLLDAAGEIESEMLHRALAVACARKKKKCEMVLGDELAKRASDELNEARRWRVGASSVTDVS